MAKHAQTIDNSLYGLVKLTEDFSIVKLSKLNLGFLVLLDVKRRKIASYNRHDCITSDNVCGSTCTHITVNSWVGDLKLYKKGLLEYSRLYTMWGGVGRIIASYIGWECECVFGNSY